MSHGVHWTPCHEAMHWLTRAVKNNKSSGFVVGTELGGGKADLHLKRVLKVQSQWLDTFLITWGDISWLESSLFCRSAYGKNRWKGNGCVLAMCIKVKVKKCNDITALLRARTFLSKITEGTCCHYSSVFNFRSTSQITLFCYTLFVRMMWMCFWCWLSQY